MVFIFNKLVFNFTSTCNFKQAKFSSATKLDASTPAATFKSAFAA